MSRNEILKMVIDKFDQEYPTMIIEAINIEKKYNMYQVIIKAYDNDNYEMINRVYNVMSDDIVEDNSNEEK